MTVEGGCSGTSWLKFGICAVVVRWTVSGGKLHQAERLRRCSAARRVSRAQDRDLRNMIVAGWPTRASHIARTTAVRVRIFGSFSSAYVRRSSWPGENSNGVRAVSDFQSDARSTRPTWFDVSRLAQHPKPRHPVSPATLVIPVEGCAPS